jgi:hypothetical protein
MHHLMHAFGDVCVNDDVREFLAELDRRKLDLYLDIYTNGVIRAVPHKVVRDLYDM